MSVRKPELLPLSSRGPLGGWQAELAKPAPSGPESELASTPPGPHDPGMDARLAKLEAVVPTLATKADMEGVRADLHKMDASIVRWMIATVLTLFLGFAGLFFTMQSSINGALDRAASQVKQQQAVAPAPTVTIQLPSATQLSLPPNQSLTSEPPDPSDTKKASQKH